MSTEVVLKSANADTAGSLSREEAAKLCADLLASTDVLGALASEISRCGTVGDLTLPKLVFLSSYTRFSPKPVSIAVKGSSSAGKSHLVESALRYIPEAAYIDMSGGGSVTSIANLVTDVRHKHLYIGEYSANAEGDGQKFLRILLSEGKIRRGVAEQPGKGSRYETEVRNVQGPTGAFVTTTNRKIHDEEETRFLSYFLEPTEEERREIIRAKTRAASQPDAFRPNPLPWHAFHDWIAGAPTTVSAECLIPIAEKVNLTLDGIARIWDHVIQLTKAHAVLHQQHRQRADGHIVATQDDYLAVEALVGKALATNAAEGVTDKVRQVTEAVTSIATSRPEFRAGVPQFVIGDKLYGDQSRAWEISRAVKVAVGAGYIRSDRKGRKEDKLVPGSRPLPGEVRVLPNREDLEPKA